MTQIKRILADAAADAPSDWVHDFIEVSEEALTACVADMLEDKDLSDMDPDDVLAVGVSYVHDLAQASLAAAVRTGRHHFTLATRLANIAAAIQEVNPDAYKMMLEAASVADQSQEEQLQRFFLQQYTGSSPEMYSAWREKLSDPQIQMILDGMKAQEDATPETDLYSTEEVIPSVPNLSDGMKAQEDATPETDLYSTEEVIPSVPNLSAKARRR